MNYRHAYHAGNFADVAKHLALIAALEHLKKKDKPFAVIDSHGGRGRYDLAGPEAGKTNEAAAGIVALRRYAGSATPLLDLYRTLTAAEGESAYPGSPLIAARLLRPQDRLVVAEKHSEEAAALQAALALWPRTQVMAGDGYALLRRLTPPPERRGVILIDPPYEQTGELTEAIRALAAAYRRFATGIYLLWFPLKAPAAAAAAGGELLAAGVDKLLRLDIALSGEGDGLRAAGLLIVNPPFGLDGQMDAAAPVLKAALGARLSQSWLAGGP